MSLNNEAYPRLLLGRLFSRGEVDIVGSATSRHLEFYDTSWQNDENIKFITIPVICFIFYHMDKYTTLHLPIFYL